MSCHGFRVAENKFTVGDSAAGLIFLLSLSYYLPKGTKAMVDRLGRNPTYQYEFIKVEQDDKAIMTVTLNRPEKRNAFTPAWHIELPEIFEKIHRDDRVRCVILT